MLVLSRKKNQGILIRGKDGDVRVVALEADCLADDAGKRWSVVVVGMLVVEQTEAEPDGSCPSPRFLLNTEFVSGWCSSPPSSLGSPSLDTEQEVPTRVL